MTISNWNPDLNVSPGTAKASLDGYLTIPWAGGTNSPTPPPLTGVLFTTGSSGGFFFSSVDGQTWLQHASPNPAATVDQIIWSPFYSAWFASAQLSSTTYFATSTDGLTWTALTPLTGPYQGIVSMGATLWTADASGHSQTSTDGGVTWNRTTNVPPVSGWQIAAQNGTALLASNGGGVAAVFNTTTDGIILTSAALPGGALFSVSQPHGVCVSAGLFCVLTQALADNSPGILTSATGATGTWTSYTAPASMAFKILATIAGNGAGTWILLAVDGTTAYSTDNMVTWNAMTNLGYRPFRVTYSATLGLFAVAGNNGISALQVTANPALGWSAPTTLPTGGTVIEDIGVRG